METTLIKIAQLLLSLSLLVFVHELGHFGFARLFKVRVDKFYLFFNPKFSLIRFKRINGKFQFKFFAPNLPEHTMEAKDENGITITDKKGKAILVPAPLDELDDTDWRKYPENTEWGIGWLPLGGYCKIAGMIDESMDTTLINTPAQPWEYRAQKAWKRMFIITGGVLMNFITAIVIYSMMLFAWGEQYIPTDKAYLGYDYCETAIEYGFKNGDRILTVDGEKIEQDRDVVEKIIIEGGTKISLLRQGEEIQLTLPKEFGEKMLEANETRFMAMRVPFVVESAVAGSPAEKAGLIKGDSVVAINNKITPAYSDITKELDTLKGKTTTIEYFRNGTKLSSEIEINKEGKIGVQLTDIFKYFQKEKIEYGLFASIPAGIKLGWETLANYVKQFRLVFTKAGAKSVGGFIAIGNIFPGMWDWTIFWNMTAMLSIMLAFMNILPIPVLDGGYFLMIIYEMITGRKPSDKFMEVALNIGMILLFALLIFANGNDIIKLFK